MDVRELKPRVWRWTAPHPDWTPQDGGPDGWDENVASYFVEAQGALLLFDPLVPQSEPDRERFWAALDRDVERLGPPAVLLTVFWHARSTRAVAERYAGTTIWASARQANRVRDRAPLTHPFEPGDTLPGAVEALPTARGGETLFWLPGERAVVAGDALLGTPDGGVRLCPQSWLPEGTTHEHLNASLRPVLELPVEAVLLAHGEPVLDNAREALSRALAVAHRTGRT